MHFNAYFIQCTRIYRRLEYVVLIESQHWEMYPHKQMQIIILMVYIENM